MDAKLIDALPAAERALWATAMYAGLRLGELQALDWQHVDLASGVIRVERSFDPKAGFVEPKSRKGKRTVPIPAVLRDVLDEHKIRSERSTGLVFGRAPGAPPLATTVLARARKVWKEAKLAPITPHECRHTFASLMIAAGVNPKALSTYMGHANIAITMDRYGHLFPGNENEAAGLLDAYPRSCGDAGAAGGARRRRLTSECAHSIASMTQDVDAIVKQLDEIIAQVEGATTWNNEYDGEMIAEKDGRRLYTRLRAAIERLAPPGSVYAQEAAKVEGYPGYMAMQLGQIAEALSDDYKSGAMEGIVELVHAALFEDFLELSMELTSKGFYAPAAVVAGAVLEEHARKLAEKHEIDVKDAKGRPRTFDTLATELVKKNAISEPRRKILVGWYGQRSAAAHGEFDKVVEVEVDRMIEGIRDFVDTHPA